MTIIQRVSNIIRSGAVGTPAELAAELGLTPAQVSRAAAKLITEGWITRERAGRTYVYRAIGRRAGAARRAQAHRRAARKAPAPVERYGLDVDAGWNSWQGVA